MATAANCSFGDDADILPSHNAPRPHSVPPGYGGASTGNGTLRASEEEINVDPEKQDEQKDRKRRYYVEEMVIESQLKEGEIRDGKTGFLKHFDIDLHPGTATTETDTSDPAGYLRIYYSDFLNNKEHDEKMHSLNLAWKKRRDDLKALFQWVSEMRPRTRMDAYPMLLILQEMLKTVLSEKYEFHLQALQKANEKLDVMDGDNAELKDQIGRLEDELIMSHEKTEQLEEALRVLEETTRKAENEISHLQEELKALTEEVVAREAERQKYLKTLHKLQTDLEQKQSDYAVIKLRTANVEDGLKARKEQVVRWKYTAQEIMDEESTDFNIDSEADEQDEPRPQPDLDAMAVQVSKASSSLLDHYLQYWQFYHIINLDGGDSIADMELQYLMQLACEVVASVLQADCVYIAELVANDRKGAAAKFLKGEDDKNLANGGGVDIIASMLMENAAVEEEKEKPSERAVIEFDETADFVFMFVAATANNNFLLGTKIPSSSVTHTHFINDGLTHPLQVHLSEQWDEIFFFKDGAADHANRDAQYIAVPVFDLKGQVAAFIAVDTLHMAGKVEGVPPPHLFDPWRVDMLHSVSDCLGRGLELSKGLANDLEEMTGPVYFAKRIVEIIAGRSAEMVDDEEPTFLTRFPFLIDLAKRGCNAFGCFTAEMPRKRYFTADEEFAMEQLDDMRDLRVALQEAIFAENRMRKEIKLMCSLPAPPPETLKVWRSVIVLLGLKGDEVLNTDQSVAWDQIRYILSEERPVKDRIFTIVRDFDPAKAPSKDSDARYNLASGLTQTVRPKQLQREGTLSVLVYEWVLMVQWTRALALAVKEGASIYNKDML